MPFWGMAKWPAIGGWLLISVASHSRFYCIYIVVFYTTKWVWHLRDYLHRFYGQWLFM